jgi:hypothetical protein
MGDQDLNGPTVNEDREVENRGDMLSKLDLVCTVLMVCETIDCLR